MPTRTALIICVGLLLVSETARAGPRDSGTYGIAELEGGALLSGNGGPALRAALGAGAKWKRWPARFYIVGQFGASSYSADDPAMRGSAAEEGAFYDLTLGPRVYLPIVGALRLFVEGQFGASLASASHFEYGRSTAYAREWLWLVQVCAGLQWRLLYELSIGARVSLAFNGSGLPGVARYAGAHSAARPALTGGVTWHF